MRPSVSRREGHSLMPLLRSPGATWSHPSLTTHGRNNHSIRTEKWRYVRYKDGGEELYNHDADPLEWANLAKDAKYARVREELGAQLPQVNAPDVPSAKAKGKKKKV